MPQNFAETLKSAFILICFGIFLIYWTSAEIEAEKNIYIKSLESTAAACLGEKEGALWIAGELHLCKAVPTGIRI